MTVVRTNGFLESYAEAAVVGAFIAWYAWKALVL